MSKLEIRGIRLSLAEHDGAVYFENHDANWSPMDHKASEVRADDVEGELYVCDSQNHATWDREDQGEED